MADKEIVRVVRILEYSGPRDWMEKMMERRDVKGTRHIGKNMVIREGILGEYPESLGGNIANPELNHLLFDLANHPKDHAIEELHKRARAVVYGEGVPDEDR